MNNIMQATEHTKKLKLLYIENDLMVQESTLSVFKRFFQTIEVAVDDKDALQKYHSNSFDLIITDINMPRLNGLEMIKEIRKIDKEISILIFSAYYETQYFIDSIKLGVDGYLIKPININQFIDVLLKTASKIKFQIEAKKNLHFLKQYEDVTNHGAIVSKINTKGIITYVNKAFCNLSGYTEDELIGKHHNIIRHPDNPTSLYEEMWNTIKDKKEIWQGLIRNLAKNGVSYYIQITIKPILNEENEIVEYISLKNDVTDIMNPKKMLEDFIEATANPLAIMIKIDEFEDIEKLYGRKIARKIEEKFTTIIIDKRPKECELYKIYPLGYGKYVFAKNKDECTIDIEKIEKILKTFQHNLNNSKIDTGEFDYDISVVISYAYGTNVLENLNYGMSKLRETKKDFILANGLYLKEQETAKKNMQTIMMIKTAIKTNKIISYFQPIINNKTQKIEKYESLVRLTTEDGKVLAPFFFLDISKRGKYYSQITLIVLENSFKMLHKIDEEISINLSALDIEMPSIQEFIFELLEKNKENTHRIVFELLEDENVKDFKIIKTFIKEVKKYGVQIAIDDFGAGYSNFERLLDYQPDILKIDGCLIKDIQTDKYSKSIVETIIDFAKKQNLKVLAEYVENEAIFNILNKLGIEYSQGYYFGKPEPL